MQVAHSPASFSTRAACSSCCALCHATSPSARCVSRGGPVTTASLLPAPPLRTTRPPPPPPPAGAFPLPPLPPPP
eukprot:6167124-Prymnesium_polylepis.1